uniref:Putative TRAF-like family protein n=1 Tax=Davidia involucrata TaxID=16924 RepID=A0A5B7CAD4_DAVIN
MEEMNIKKRKRLMKEMSYNDDEVEVSRTTRDVPPAHYLFKIESFSLLSGSYIEKYESGVFEAGGYKWRLLLYPKGNSKDNGNDHISLYLAIADTKSLPRGWEVYINFKLFVYDQIRDKYLTVQDADGKVRRFHGLKTERGFGQLLSLNTFNDASNGYLLHDSCIFGAEVFAIKYNGNGECLSMTQMHQDNTYTWKIYDFSSIDAEFIRSKEFTVGENKWKLSL